MGMIPVSVGSGAFASALMLASISLCSVAGAQVRGTTSSPQINTLTTNDSKQTNDQLAEKEMREILIDPKEQAAYKAFQNASEPAKKIRLGKEFINQYPNGYYLEAVYDELAQTYYARQDLTNFYSYADQGISRFPDDVSLLAMNGWVIPHAYNHDDPEADKKLDKAENYEKRAIVVMNGMRKPTNMSDQQFSEYKTEELALAHSGLGLVYFRRGDYGNSAKELQAAISSGAPSDPTDFYVLGADLESLNRYNEAAEAFKHCADMASSLQDTCKLAADGAQKQAAQTK
jgi:hypothetical protein